MHRSTHIYIYNAEYIYTSATHDRPTDRPTHYCDARNILFDNYVFIMYAFFTTPENKRKTNPEIPYEE